MKRYKNLSAREIWLRRDQTSGKELVINDQDLGAIRTKVRKRILFKEIGKQHAINNTQQIYTPDLQINTNYHARKLLLNNNTYSGVFKGIQHFPKEPGQNHKTYFP